MMDIGPLKILLDAHKEEFERYSELLIKWNRTYNITAISNPREIIEKHFLDSLTPLKYLPERGSLLDIGTGGGFPGVPLKIVHPALSVSLIDSVQKKCRFCENIVRELGLNDVKVIHGRAENKTVENSAGKFDVIISRAALELKDFIKIGHNYLKNAGSILISMKGDNIKNELNNSHRILNEKKMEIKEIEEYFLNKNIGKRNLIVIGAK